jgi:hypothetical protein
MDEREAEIRERLGNHDIMTDVEMDRTIYDLLSLLDAAAGAGRGGGAGNRASDRLAAEVYHLRGELREIAEMIRNENTACSCAGLLHKTILHKIEGIPGLEVKQ